MVNSFQLVKTKTKDGITLHGVFTEPKRSSLKVLILVHGLGGSFYSGQGRTIELAEQCSKQGIALAVFNNRGHDIIASFAKEQRGKSKTTIAGYALERFEDCIYDIEAQIRFVRKKGYKTIYLAGHSTGANKVLYYMYKTKDRKIQGLALLSPISDVSGQRLALGNTFEDVLKKIKRFAKTHKKDIVPPEIYPRIISAERYLSLYTPGSKEDVFPYYNPKAKFKELSSIKIPLLVVVGSADEYLDRPAEELIDIFRKKTNSTKQFTGFVIKRGAHGFLKKEEELARTIIEWIQNI